MRSRAQTFVRREPLVNARGAEHVAAFERDQLLLLVAAERFVADQTREEIAWNFVHGQVF